MSVGVPILEVEDLDVVYRADEGSALKALRGVSFAVARDEVLGLVGESGSGKSTVALAIVRYLAANGAITGGSVRVEGTDVTSLDDRALRATRARRIGMVYQDPASALNPSRRVGEQIAELYRVHFGAPRAAARERATEMLARVHLPDAERAYDRFPHEFSGGQQQRIVIAMALAADPDLLILDEPTTGLDSTVQAEILELFAELRQSVRAATVFISHDIGLIGEVCDRIAVLYAGEIVETGPTSDVLTTPRHPYTRALLSCAVPAGATKHTLRLASRGGSARLPVRPAVRVRARAMPGRGAAAGAVRGGPSESMLLSR